MTRLSRHLILFVKAPRFGGVKSRLARDVGPLAAWAFYRRTLQATLRRLGRDPRWRTWIALAPDRAAFRPLRPRPPVRARTFAQGGGDLGARMARAFARLPPGPAVLVGGDIPGILPAHLAEAFRRLGAFDAVFGPAADGGYYLVGMARYLSGFFEDIPWSTPRTLSAHQLACQQHDCSFGLLPTLHDIDTLEDWLDYQRRGIERT